MSLIKEPDTLPILVYNAPVGEKTKKVREMFDMDEETGYPRHYNWRTMAKLGKSYRPEKALELIDHWQPEQRGYSTKISLVLCTVIPCMLIHRYFTVAWARPYWSKPWIPLSGTAASLAAVWLVHDAKLARERMKREIHIDYLKSHPERFETIQRYKFREVLFPYIPVR